MYSEYEGLEGACSEKGDLVYLFHYKEVLGKLSVSCAAISSEQNIHHEPRDDMTPEEQRDSFCWNCPLNPRSPEENAPTPFR